MIRRSVPIAAVQLLEPRCLLSASFVGSYSGVVHVGANGNFPASASAPNALVRSVSLQITSQGTQGALQGTASVAGLGNFAVIGLATGRTFKIFLEGTSTGEMTGTLNSTGAKLTGSLFDRTNGRQLGGTFSAARVDSVNTTSATLSVLATPVGRLNYSIAELMNTFTGSLTVPARTAATAGIAAKTAMTIDITSENTDGLLHGTVTVNGLGSFGLVGLSTIRSFEIIFDGTSGTGELIGTAGGNGVLTGTYLEHSASGQTIKGTFRTPGPGVGTGTGGGSTVGAKTTPILVTPGGTPTTAGNPTGTGTGSPGATAGGLASTSAGPIVPVNGPGEVSGENGSGNLFGQAGTGSLFTETGTTSFGTSLGTGVGGISTAGTLTSSTPVNNSPSGVLGTGGSSSNASSIVDSIGGLTTISG